VRKATRSRQSNARNSSRRRRALRARRGRVDALLPRRRVAQLARSTGFTRRRRKVLALAFLLALVFGFGIEMLRSMASFQRFFTTITKLSMARSAFQKKFSERSVAFFRAVFIEACAHHARRLGTRLGGKLARFKDVCAIDATVIRLHDLLKKTYAATRTNHTKAAAKLHAVLSFSKRAVTQLAITAERVGDREFLKDLDWVAGRLLLFDLGYYAHTLFAAIAAKEGFFLSRLKDKVNPTIVRVRRGLARDQKAVGKRLFEIDFADGRPVDLDVRFGDRADAPCFRLVGVYNDGSRCWHLYVTNLPVSEFSPEDLALIYRARWEVELLFKELKGTHRLDEIGSAREAVVLTMLYATLLSLLVTRVLARLVEDQDGHGARRLSLRILSSYLIQHAKFLANAILRGGRSLGSRLNEVGDDIGRTCRDPNPQRPSVLARLAA
jgi:putative transposase